MYVLRLPLFDADLLLSPPWPSWPPLLAWGLLGLLALAALALIAWLYRYELHLAPARAARSLLGLRLLVVALILLLVCLKPVYARTETFQLPGRVLVAVDRSDSMNVADPQREPAEKLRLARALGLARGLCSNEQLTAWIKDYEQKREPRWVTPAEARDPVRRRQLETERRRAHDEVCARVDTLTRTAAARRILGEDGLNLLGKLLARHKVEVLGFHRETWDVKADRPAAMLEGLFAPSQGEKTAGAGAFTDVRLPLVRALERTGPGQGKVLGIVLLTDGQHNWGEPPSKKARELGQRGVPIYPVALGARTAPPDVAVVSVRGPNHTVFKDVDADVEVKFKISGLRPGDFLVELHRHGKDRKLLGQRTVRHDGKDRLYQETFSVRLDEAGTQTLVASVRPVNPDVKETLVENNTRATTLSVADDKAAVLLIDGEARWEFHYLATALQRDRTMDVKSVVFDQPRLDERLTAEDLERLGSPMQQLPAGPDVYAKYQCIILGDVDPARLPPAERQRLARYVGDTGGTLVVLAGKRFMPLAFPTTGADGQADPLRKLLPIDDPQVLAPADGFALALTRAGSDTRFMRLAPDDKEEDEALWAGRPQPWGWAVAGRAKPGATPLAYVAGSGDEGTPLSERERRQAVIVRHNYGFGRVLFVGLDSTWRWRYKTGDRYHHRFWGQAIRWAAADKPLVVGNQFLRFGTPQPTYAAGDRVEVVVRLGDALGPVRPDLLAGARVVRLADDPRQKERSVALVPLKKRPAQPRVLSGQVGDLAPGRYAVELAIPDLADKVLEPGKEGKPLRAAFTVQPPEGAEMVDLETRWPLLEDLAAKSGGKVYTPEDAAQLVERLVNESVPHVERHEQLLYRWGWMLGLVVALLTLEWVGRKWVGLP
jgi:hypothetical protein